MQALSLFALLLVAACGASVDGGSQDADGGASNAADAAPAADAFAGTPVRELPGLENITFWERTGGDGPTGYTFDVNGPELTGQLVDPLSLENSDIQGVPASEFYDVYYSDAEGVFDIDGSYLTISGVFGAALPAGGGLNLAEMQLNFVAGAPPEFGSEVASFVALGDNAHPELVDRCIDDDLATHTVMGNTVGSSERVRITLGFASTLSID
jgi:hypothetical protein